MTTRATRSPRRRTVVALALVLVILAAFVVRLVDIQVVNANDHIDDSQTFATGAKQISIWRQLANDAEKRANAAGAGFGFTPLARRTMKAPVTAPQAELFPNEHNEAVDRYFTH